MKISELKSVLRLATTYLLQRPGRYLLTSLSTVAAACVVVWVVSGYDSLVGQFGSMGEEYVGRYDVLLVPARDRGGEAASPGPTGFGRSSQLSKELMDKLRLDPAVTVLEPVYETSLRAGKIGGDSEPQPKGPKQPATGPIIMGGVAQQRTQGRTPTVVGTNSMEPLHAVLEGQWFDPKDTKEAVGALTKDSAEQLGIHVGDEVAVSSGFGEERETTKVRVVAIVDQSKRLPGPKFMVGLPPTRAGALPGGPAASALYVSIPLAETLSGSPARISYAGVKLAPGEKVEEFQARWAEPFGKASPPVEVRTPSSVDSEVDNSTTFATVRAQAYSATGISLLAALFIIFTTLSMGVDERVRQFAMLRAVSFTRGQIGVLVVVESVILGVIGWGGGLLAGWALLKLMAHWKPELLSEGAALGMWCVVLSGVCAMGGSLAAAVMPAWRATHVSPLEAMAPQRRSSNGRLPWIITVVGLLLIAVYPLVLYYIPMPDTARYMAAAAIGCTTMVVGFVMLAPAAVVLIERLLGPALAWILRLNPRLLATQLSSNMGRTVGTAVAMTIGLGLFVATQTWGYSMLAPFTPGDWAPDLVISIPSGVPDAQIDAVRGVPGLKKDKFLPLALKHVKFADDPTGFKIRESATRQDSCVMVGFDPDAALGGSAPVFKFRFVEGDRNEAITKLKRGRFCLVPDHFARESGLGIGDTFAVLAGGRTGERLDYEIAGIVSIPGWHWITKTGFRQGRAAGLMFCDRGVVQKDFAAGRTTTFWGDMDGTATEDEIKTSLQALLDRPPPPADAQARSGRGAGKGPTRGAGGRGGVAVTSAEMARKEVRNRADNIIWALSELPLVTLLVTSLGVMNTVLASVRARRWDMGVLRSLGVTRFGLFRLILAESLLIGVVACVLSLGFGTMAGYCGTGVTRYVNIRGGQYTPLIVPWEKLGVGFAIAVGLCLVVSLWPALRTGRTETLRLLQAGRSAA